MTSDFLPPGPVVAHDSNDVAVAKNSAMDNLCVEKAISYNLTERLSKLHTVKLCLVQSFVLSARSLMIGSL
jgi:hypothetical protein